MYRWDHSEETISRYGKVDSKITQIVKDYLNQGFVILGPESCRSNIVALFDEKNDMVYEISCVRTPKDCLVVFRCPKDKVYIFPREEGWELVFKEEFE